MILRFCCFYETSVMTLWGGRCRSALQDADCIEFFEPGAVTGYKPTERSNRPESWTALLSASDVINGAFFPYVHMLYGFLKTLGLNTLTKICGLTIFDRKSQPCDFRSGFTALYFLTKNCSHAVFAIDSLVYSDKSDSISYGHSVIPIQLKKLSEIIPSKFSPKFLQISILDYASLKEILISMQCLFVAWLLLHRRSFLNLHFPLSCK